VTAYVTLLKIGEVPHQQDDPIF